jgi:hypothetical protein
MNCPICVTGRIIKAGVRYNKHDISQRCRCQNCGYSYLHSDERFHDYKTPAKIVMYAILRYFDHPTVREVQKELAKKFGVTRSAVTICHWIKDEKKIRSRLDNRRKIMPPHAKQLLRLQRDLGVAPK